MNASKVVDIYRTLEARGVEIWIDGGWSVDAVLGRQTRDHDDLDIAAETKDEERLMQCLSDLGFSRATDRPSEPWNYVLIDGAGHRIDVHLVQFGLDGKAYLGDPARDQAYPAGALDGVGTIVGVTVRCVTAEAMLGFKLSYPPRDRDRHDIQVLCAILGRGVPQTDR